MGESAHAVCALQHPWALQGQHRLSVAERLVRKRDFVQCRGSCALPWWQSLLCGRPVLSRWHDVPLCEQKLRVWLPSAEDRRLHPVGAGHLCSHAASYACQRACCSSEGVQRGDHRLSCTAAPRECRLSTCPRWCY